MAAAYELKAQARTGVGKGAARALRRQGMVPAVIYGDKKAPVGVAISYKDAYKNIYAGGFLSHVITLDVDGEKHTVIPRAYQLDPVKDFPIHIDFLRIGSGSKITVEVHVTFVNDQASPGIKRGGVLNIVRHTVELSCPADQIPDHLTVDLTGKEVGDSIHISSVDLPPGVTATVDRDFTIATIVAPSGLRAEEGGAAAEAAEPKKE